MWTCCSSKSTRYPDPGFGKLHYNSLRPLPNMVYDDADLILVNVLKNKARYAKPVDGPLFAAHIPSVHQNLGSSNSTVYLSDFPASVIGCKIRVGSLLRQAISVNDMHVSTNTMLSRENLQIFVLSLTVFQLMFLR